MSEPRRFREHDALAASLLSAARAYRPTAQAHRRTLKALGLPLAASLAGSTVASATTGSAATMTVAAPTSAAGATALAGTGAAKVMTSATLVTAKLWVGAVAVAVVGAGAGVTQHVMHEPTRAPSVVVARAEPATRRPSPPDVVEPSGSAQPKLVVPELARHTFYAKTAVAAPRRRPPPAAPQRREPSFAPPPAAAPVSAEPSIAHATAPSTRELQPPPFSAPDPVPLAVVKAPSLAPELAVVQAADEALRAGRPLDALASLEEHDRRFAAGELRDEAAVLRIAALARSGDYRRARELGETFLRTHDPSLLCDRVRRILSARASPRGPAP